MDDVAADAPTNILPVACVTGVGSTDTAWLDIAWMTVR